MKRPTRPVVVEVKKRRGSPAKPRSIWGDLDLSALAADPSATTEFSSEPVGNDRDRIWPSRLIVRPVPLPQSIPHRKMVTRMPLPM